MFKWNYESPRRGGGTPAHQFGEFDAAFGGWTLESEPYTSARGNTFDWFRSRMLGGRTNHWDRILLRFGPHDFRRKSMDGLGDDWPITYEDLKPYSDEIDPSSACSGPISVHGSRKSRTANSCGRRCRVVTSCSSGRRPRS